MHSENIVVMGIFRRQAHLEMAIDSLKIEGFRTADVAALLPSTNSTRGFAHEKATKSPEGAAIGGASGLLLGGALGWLTGVGAIVSPGLGILIAAGPIVSLLAGAGLGGTIGGLAGALTGMGFPEYEAKRYEGQIHRGGHLLSVHCDNKDWAEKARLILEDLGATEISSTFEAKADIMRDERPMTVSHRL